MTKKASDHYEVGYGKPPKGSQYKPGQSGNPGGQPRKISKPEPASLAEIMAEEMQRRIPVMQNGKRRLVEAPRLVVMTMLKDAIAGNPRARKEALALIELAYKTPKLRKHAKIDLDKISAKDAMATYLELMRNG